jgi:hypothetical protein
MSHIHGKRLWVDTTNVAETPDEPEPEFLVSMPDRCMEIKCPVPNCEGKASNRYSLRRHFMYRHPEASLVIEEEGRLPRCPHCCMFVPENTLQKHDKTIVCKQGNEQKRKREEDQKRQSTTDMPFYVDDKAINTVDCFKYLGRWLDENDNDLTAVRANIKKARDRWARFSRVLFREGADMRTMGIFYKTIVLAVLLYGAETWTLTQRQVKILESFHRQCARSITGRWISCDADGIWTCPDTETTLELAGLLPIAYYIGKRRNKLLLKFAKDRASYRRCMRTSCTPRTAHKILWWNLSFSAESFFGRPNAEV